jgi:hypothetical protein
MNPGDVGEYVRRHEETAMRHVYSPLSTLLGCSILGRACVRHHTAFVISQA